MYKRQERQVRESVFGDVADDVGEELRALGVVEGAGHAVDCSGRYRYS